MFLLSVGCDCNNFDFIGLVFEEYIFFHILRFNQFKYKRLFGHLNSSLHVLLLNALHQPIRYQNEILVQTTN